MSDLLTGLPRVVRSAGLRCVVAPDAATNRLWDKNLKDVRGLVIHTSESTDGTFKRSKSDAPTLEWTRHGLGYPTYHFLIGRTGTVYVNTYGIGAHAGRGTWPVKGDNIPDDMANYHTLGISMDANGSEYPVTADQLEAICRLIKALQADWGGGLSVVMHGEYQPKTRTDPTGVDWDRLRKAAARGYWSDPNWSASSAKTAARSKTSTHRVTTPALFVRSGPGTNYDKAGLVKAGEAFTIVEKKKNWGRLKSGAGWICLDYTKEVA